MVELSVYRTFRIIDFVLYYCLLCVTVYTSFKLFRTLKQHQHVSFKDHRTFLVLQLTGLTLFCLINFIAEVVFVYKLVSLVPDDYEGSLEQ